MGVRSQRAVEVRLAVGREFLDIDVSLGTAWSLSVTSPVLARILGVLFAFTTHSIQDIYNYNPICMVLRCRDFKPLYTPP